MESMTPGEGFLASAVYNIYRLSSFSVKQMMCDMVPVLHPKELSEWLEGNVRKCPKSKQGHPPIHTQSRR